MSVKRKKTVLHFLNTGNYSGAENVAITIIKYMREKWGYTLYYVSVDGEINGILAENGIEHISVPKSGIREFQRVINRYHPDVIHAHDFTTSILLSCTHSGAIRISHLHNNPLWIKRINVKTILYSMSSKRYRYILAVSQKIFDEYVFGKAIQDKSIVVDNPIDILGIVEKATQTGEYEECDVLFLGRLTEQKNPKRFIEIINGIYEHNRNVKALMIGKGELEDECKALIDAYKMQNVIKMIGFKRNPYGYLKNAKVLCLLSDWEGFGLVIAEAFSLGIPVIATPVGGISRLVTQEAGLLSNDNETISREIERLISDKKYHKKKMMAALKRAEELNNINEYMEKINSYYVGIGKVTDSR